MTFSLSNISASATGLYNSAQEQLSRTDATGSYIRAAAAIVGSFAIACLLDAALPYVIVPTCIGLGIAVAYTMVTNPNNTDLIHTARSAIRKIENVVEEKLGLRRIST